MWESGEVGVVDPERQILVNVLTSCPSKTMAGYV